MNCSKHRRYRCTETVCRRERERNQSADDLTNPVSPLHQAVYGGAFYDSGDSSPSSSDSTSGSDCGSSSSDSGSSSSEGGGFSGDC